MEQGTGAGDRVTLDAWRWFLIAGAVATVTYFLIPGSDVQPLVYELLAGLAAAAVVVGVRLHGPRRASGWFFLAGGVAMWAFGDLVWSAHESLFDTPPFPSFADVIYLASYPLLLAGVVRLVRDRCPGRDVAALLDAIAVAVAVAVPVWIVLLAPVHADGSTTFAAKVVATAYPVADVLVFAVLVRLLVSPGPRPTAYWLLLGGILSNLVADLIFAIPEVAADYTAGAPLDGFYLFGYVLLGAAALHPSMLGVNDHTEPPRTASRARVLLVALAGLSAPVVLGFEAASGDIEHLPLILGAWCLLLLILVARLVMLMHQLTVEARTDPLTRLPNRAHLIDRVDSLLRRRDGVADDVALLYLDIDGFRLVNESVGRAHGDQLLIDIAERLRTCVRPGDLVARLGGDEFVVLCEDVADEAGARAVADRLTHGLVDPFWVGGTPHFLSASIGISRATSADAHALGLLTDADAAMERARSNGRSHAELYDPSMRRELSLRGRFEHDLFEALDRGELVLHYQPVLDLRSSLVAGVEALLRWQHPDWGMTKPESILPIAEETGLIVPIGRWVVAEACRQLAAWQRDEPATAPGEVTVNVSRRELLDPAFLANVEASLQRAHLLPDALVLDVADDELADTPSAALDALNRARGLGVHVCIDHFGAGRRSLTNVRRVPADRLKVDRSLVGAVADDPGDRIVFASVLQLGLHLGLQVTAAGIETRSQRTQLERMGCSHAQGNLWAPPLPPGSVLDAVLGRAVAT